MGLIVPVLINSHDQVRLRIDSIDQVSDNKLHCNELGWFDFFGKGLEQANAQLVMAGMDSLIAVVDKKRAELGAVQNRFQATIRNQANISENLSAAKSRIKDADFAMETAKLTKNQILQQASQTILGQANQRPQAALSLLQG